MKYRPQCLSHISKELSQTDQRRPVCKNWHISECLFQQQFIRVLTNHYWIPFLLSIFLQVILNSKLPYFFLCYNYICLYNLGISILRKASSLHLSLKRDFRNCLTIHFNNLSNYNFFKIFFSKTELQ